MTKEDLNIKLDEFINNLELEEKANRTLISYRNAVNKLIEYLPSENIILNKKIIMDWKNSIQEEGFSLNSCNQYIVVVNKFLYYLGLNDLVVKQFKIQEKSSLEEYIEPQEHKRMLRWAKQLNMMEAYMIMKVFAHSGARISELKYFKVDKLDSNYIKVYNKKKERYLIITNELRRELKHYCKDNKLKEGYIFRSTDDRFKNDPNKMPNQSTIWRWLKKIAKRAKINANKIHAHAWRHLFAKQCKENGIDLDELADILGHSNINTTAIYTKTSKKEKRQKLEKIKY